MIDWLPNEFIDKMRALLREESVSFFSSYQENRTAGLRINSLKVDKEKWNELSPFLTEEIPFVGGGYYYSYNKEEPGKHPYHASGLYYIQEPSAMFVATLLDAKPNEKILDLCAAPGGKSTQLAGRMENQGLLISNEVYPKRAKALSENIERLGITNTIVTNETPDRLAKSFQGYFDKILVDAPCSGEGMFRKDHEAANYWSKDHVEECALLQKQILDSAYHMLGEGGVLVYSTCTFSPEENEQVIEHFLSKYPDMELMDIEKVHGIDSGRPEWTLTNREDIRKTARLWPHKMLGEGHFAAKLRKSGASQVGSPPQQKHTKSKDLKDLMHFQELYLENTEFQNLILMGSQVYSLPDECPDLKGIKVVRSGLHIGEMKKNRFEPNHALALALSREQVKHYVELDINGSDWLGYLKGETLKSTSSFKGWVLITIKGFPIGWGKQSDGIIKNLYPKGLRIQ